MTRAVLLLSGGLDSAANLAICAEKKWDLLALTADYGQRSAARERAASQSLCRYYGVPHEEVDLRWLGGLGTSALTDRDSPVPEVETQDLERGDVVRASAARVWVPNRNGVLIAVASAFAEARSRQCVVVGFNREEAATFPDNSIEFMNHCTRALSCSTRNAVQVVSHTATLDKKAIVEALRALARPFPFDAVWSCYHGDETRCGRCESCRRFERALR